MLTVSIVIPVYNGARTIGQCLESLLQQNYPRSAYEIIVVENGSTDSTAQIVAGYPVRLVHCAQRGPAAARNMGIAMSSADIVAFIDADCVATRDWLAELVRPYEDPAVGATGGDIQAFRNPQRTVVESFLEAHPPLINFLSGAHEFLPHLYTANASYRREILVRAGGFNPGLITGEDVDLSWRTQLKTRCKVCYAPAAVVYHNHRTTFAGVAKLYRQYGFGEIMLDTMYRHHPGYPRPLHRQLRRILNQISVLPRYMLAIPARRLQCARGKISPEQALWPWIWLLIESSNIRGKIEALIATRMMTRGLNVSPREADVYIENFY